ncbi:nuclease-related domain-containing protein [Oceanobacillus sp. Castelsardo]|uniref:nuclease-related domain-containing protein n=1 Tax=Oceanobacillus sp. Castelsardo TaxID=1851204 RepID=UPI0008399B8A|nr:nuclease-related domain-containing protein [Oceanobacillus sp. Castelsardo]
MYDPRNKKLELLTFQAFERRLSANHPMKQTVLKDLKIKQAEVSGENEIKYRLRLIDKQKFMVLHNLRLQDEDGHFQMDTLILSKFFNNIVETKNWTVRFGANGQVTRIDNDGLKEGFQNPIDQVKIQALRLKRWLKNHHFPDIPIEYLAVISFPKTIIERETPQDIIPHELIHSSDLVFRIQDIEKKYNKPILSKSQVHRLARLLEHSHCPVEVNLFEKYGVRSIDIVKGVFCTQCGTLPMSRFNKKWYCRSCKHVSIDAHKQALRDYRLLFGEWITNKQARYFLGISSPDVTKNLLRKECTEMIGKNKGMRYRLG